MWFHLVARTWPGLRPLRDPERAAWLWDHLEQAFPAVAGACLMPDHLHLLVEAADGNAARARLSRTVGWFSRVFPFEHGVGWFRPPPPAIVIPDRQHLRRQVRYVLLNPCRARLAPDPLAWTWSTARDLVGAAADPWVTAAELAPILGDPAQRFAHCFHAYVSADPSVNPVGTDPPGTGSGPPAWSPLPAIWSAVCAATRTVDQRALQRRGPGRTLFVALALDQGWTQSALVASEAGITPRSVQRIRRAPPPPGLVAARLCLADSRLTSGFMNVARSDRGSR